MSDLSAPVLLWLRRDLRLSDHPGWCVALETGRPVIPVFILDPLIETTYGAAPLWRLGESIAALSADLEARGSRLILRRGNAHDVLDALIAETGARTLIWSRQYDDRMIARDTSIKSALTERGVTVQSVNASLMFEPWTVETGTGGIYRVYTPFWKAVRDRDVVAPAPIPTDLAAPTVWPRSDNLADWGMGDGMRRGKAVLALHACVGEIAALARAEAFLDGDLHRYKSERDLLDANATSRLSENLTYGEISPVRLWHAALPVVHQGGAAAKEAEHFLKELVWREFAYHLLYHTPHIQTGSWRTEWDDFGWQDDNAQAERWRRGMTGVEVVDAAMREMYVTGMMHNRARMLVASFLTKHLMTHWKVGMDWFADCLIDWDPASNAMGWQWTAGSGPDAAPYFRIFNPDTQAEKFDGQGAYRDRFLAEGRRNPHADALAYFDAIPRSWQLFPDQPYPEPVIGLAEGRQRALAAYERRKAA